jgi:glycosyltransferase involved in cell wall biosynthesis
MMNFTFILLRKQTMNKLPVYVCSIAKNEAKHVRQWAESAKDADGIFLLDTGSTDDTVAIAKECGVTVFEKTYDKWSFAVARNDLREMLPEHDAWLVNLDLDEVMIPNWREHWKDIPEQANRIRYRYIWNWKEDGTPGVEYHGDKLVRRHSHKWVNKVHEVNVTQEGFVETQYFLPNFEIHHHADNTKSRGSYLPLLLEDVEENPNNDRNTYYCARELFFHGRYEEATILFKRHLIMPESVWPPERAWSMRYLAKMHPDQAEHWHLRACAEYPTGAEVWTDLGKFYHEKLDWKGMYFAAKRALECQLYKGLYLTEPDAYGWWPNDLAALSAYRLGMFKEALHHGQVAVDLNPTDQRLKDNLIWYKKALTGVTVVIPTKSNINGLTTLTSALMSSEGVSRVVVVGDGHETEDMLNALPNNIIKTYVPRGSGIHKMWNVGMALANEGDHVLFLNDDVIIGTSTVMGMIDALAEDSRIGLVCPKYAGESFVDIVTHTTCRGRYDGTGGMAGFAMMLANDLAKSWRFDERMMWWYGDDDLVNWVSKKANRLCVITAKARCSHGHSVTITSNPPDNFNRLVEIDRQIFEQKWGA